MFARHVCPLKPFALLVAVAVVAATPTTPTRAGPITLLTATTDSSGGSNPVAVPGDDPNLPAINAGVTISPGTVKFNGQSTGPLDGVTYGPFGFGGSIGGSTGFVNVSYTIPSTYQYVLTWEVADVFDSGGQNALAIDNVTLNNSLLFGFESGIPTGFTAQGSVGTSGAVPNLSPTQGSSFAYLDTNGPGVRPIYDTIDGTSASRLTSSAFTAQAGTTLSLDMAFLTNDGAQYYDYGIATLQAVPEPAGLPLLAAALACMAGYRAGRRVRRGEG